MKNLKFQFKLIFQLIFIISFFNIIEAKSFNKFNQAKDVSNYFSGITSINKDEYTNSYEFFRSLGGLENIHYPYSKLFQYSLINLNKFNEAVKYSQKLEKKNLDNFESILISAVFHLKGERFEKAEKYFQELSKKSQEGTFQELLSSSLNNWLQFTNSDNLENSLKLLNETPERFKNIKNIQESFLHCYFDSSETDKVFIKLTNNTEVDFSRYHFFHSNYFIKKN